MLFWQLEKKCSDFYENYVIYIYIIVLLENGIRVYSVFKTSAKETLAEHAHHKPMLRSYFIKLCSMMWFVVRICLNVRSCYSSAGYAAWIRVSHFNPQNSVY